MLSWPACFRGIPASQTRGEARQTHSKHAKLVCPTFCSHKTSLWSSRKVTWTQRTMTIDTSLFCSPTPCLRCHVSHLQSAPKEYLQALSHMKDLGLSQATKSRIVAALHICKQHNPLETILKDCDVVDIAKAVKILDLRRSIHQTERKVKSIAVAHPHLLASDLSTQEKEQAPSRRNHKCTKRKKRLSLIHI